MTVDISKIVEANPRAYARGERLGMALVREGFLQDRHLMLPKIGELLSDQSIISEADTNYLPNPIFSLGVVAGASSVLLETEGVAHV